jgi:hypothetical protein
MAEVHCRHVWKCHDETCYNLICVNKTVQNCSTNNVDRGLILRLTASYMEGYFKNFFL